MRKFLLMIVSEIMKAMAAGCFSDHVLFQLIQKHCIELCIKPVVIMQDIDVNAGELQDSQCLSLTSTKLLVYAHTSTVDKNFIRAQAGVS